MYKWLTPKLPTIITRKDFVTLVFDICDQIRLNYDLIIHVIEVADKFVDYDGDRISSLLLLKKSYILENFSYREMIQHPVPQDYSVELAYVTVNIVAKAMEDFSHSRTITLAQNLENYYVFKMEREICDIINYTVKPKNIMSFIGCLIWKQPHDSKHVLDTLFWDLSKVICHDKKLLYSNPIAVLMGIIILFKKNKLSTVRENKYRTFITFIEMIAFDYNLDVRDILSEYIKVKRNSAS